MLDEQILEGFREGDSDVIRRYFYGYCYVGYCVFDRKYQLREKESLDFYSLAHQYALYLIEHDWKPLEDRSPEVSLKTWLINGFRYVVLDALKWYRKEYGSITFEEYMQTFDVATRDLRLQFNRMVEDVCEHGQIGSQDRLIIDMLLRQGFKTKEVAEQLGVTPSAISQRFRLLKEAIIIPYFKMHFDMELDMPEVMEVVDNNTCYEELGFSSKRPMSTGWTSWSMRTRPLSAEQEKVTSWYANKEKNKAMEKKRTTPEFVTELQPNEIFVFGSNLRGMHAGGAANIAYRKFGAIMGQGVGLQGQSYAIPTMQGGVETIRPYVDEFIAFAKEHAELTFLVTRIGCGIAGFTDEEIAPLFAKAHDIENIVLPPGW